MNNFSLFLIFSHFIEFLLVYPRENMNKFIFMSVHFLSFVVMSDDEHIGKFPFRFLTVYSIRKSKMVQAEIAAH